MRLHSPLNLIYIALLVGLGFAGGWWTKGWDSTPATDTGYSAPARDLSQALPERLSTEKATKTVTEIVTETQTQRDIRAAPAPRPTETAGKNTPDAPPDINSREAFRALLEAQAFREAMNLYVETERRSSNDAAELKGLAMSYLQNAQREKDHSALTGLVDAFLGRYYNDLDVLLLLADYHRKSGYLAEAASSYQLAFTYAFGQAEQQQVALAFRHFVQEADQLLAEKNQLQQLITFYETLGSLGLTQPHYQLRLAELHLSLGEVAYARNLLTRLTREPAVAAQANALLEKARSGHVAAAEQAESGRQQTTDSVALAVAGSHYHLPLRVNNAADVQLIIDTGATTTTLSRSAFDTLNAQTQLTELGPQLFNTASGVAKGILYRAATVQLGGHRLADVHIAVLEFDMPPGVDGLLGMNVLRNFRFQVEQDEQRLYLQLR